jgi:hypothetical protein
MLVHIRGHYVDTNSILFGKAVEHLKTYVVTYMMYILKNEGEKMRIVERNIKGAVDDIIKKKVFIDEMALEVWRREGNSMSMYEKAKEEFEVMFRNLVYDYNKDLIIEWVNELARRL